MPHATRVNTYFYFPLKHDTRLTSDVIFIDIAATCAAQNYRWRQHVAPVINIARADALPRDRRFNAVPLHFRRAAYMRAPRHVIVLRNIAVRRFEMGLLRIVVLSSSRPLFQAFSLVLKLFD